MKSKLVCVCVTILVSATWWTGCSSTVNNAAPVDAGGGGTDSGGTDSGPVSDAGADAPADTGVDAALTGPFVAITYGNCAAFTPCGGDPIGSFTVTGGCVGNGAFAAAKAQCAGIVESNVVFEARGTLVVDATTSTRNTEVKLAATLAVPAVCVAAIGTCADVQAAILFVAKVDTAVCTDGATAGTCDCDVTDLTAEKTSAAYTKSANTITTSNPTRTFDYCVTGNEIKYLETTANSVPATFVLTK